MRIHWVTAAMLSMATATVADAGDRIGSHDGYPADGVDRPASLASGLSRPTAAQPRGAASPNVSKPPNANKSGLWNGANVGGEPRWGGRIEGRWWAGSQAPGGWRAYRRPLRGWLLPGFWVAPRYMVSDWSGYGLPRPPSGYDWSRYYDDAVLIDGRGSVHDTIGGVDWDHGDGDAVDYAFQDRGRGAVAAPATGVLSTEDDDYAYPSLIPPVAPAAPPRRDDGVRGVSAVTGSAIDTAKDRARVQPSPTPPGAGYAPPPQGYPAAVATRAPVPVVTSNGAVTSIVTTTAGAPGDGQGGYYANGYYYPAPTITTITIQSEPAYTTTTETWVTDVPKSKVRKKGWRPARK